MTDAERDELIEKSLLKELDAPGEARVQQLLRQDDTFRQEYTFQETLIRQVRLKRRQELLGMFADFEGEQADETDAVPVVPLLPHTSQQEAPADPQRMPLWRQSWFRVAASVVLAIVLGAVVWFATNDPQPIAKSDPDSTQTSEPPRRDTLQTRPVEPPRVPTPAPQGPVAQDAKPTRLRGAARLPYYETDNISLGFGNDQSAKQYRTVVFGIGPTPAYEFQDTLKVYWPVLPTARPVWSLVYSRASDTYYLTRGKIRYEIVKGLVGKQPLLPVR